MLISHNWLKKYLPQLDDLSKQQIAESLTSRLAEVENIIPIRQELNNIISAEVVEVEKIAESNKLTHCKVRIGNDQIKDIICGAPNVKAGFKVAVCLPGGRIYDPKTNGKTIEIGVKTMYNITSNGMICSEKELGLGEDHDGIMELEPEIQIGKDLDEMLKDFVYEIENKSLSHRPDCFSHEGIAREISAILNLPFIEDNQDQPLIPTLNFDLEVSCKAEDKCDRFSAIVLSDIKVTRSPLWLKSLLQSTGLRSINNIVDASNYIMLDRGQPLHCYDYDKITSRKLVVRNAKNGELISALDEKEYKLTEEVLVISNGNNVDDLAGIMGGQNSEITVDTKNIIIEAANFNMYAIRKGSRILGLRTEASTRFEKGLDPNMTKPAIEQAVNLILDLGGGEIASELKDYYPKIRERNQIELDLTMVKRLLGIELPVREIVNYLQRLNCEVVDYEKIANISNLPETNQPVTVIVPTYRNDLKIFQDLLEEIVRLYGYDKLQPTLPEKNIEAVILNKGMRIDRRVTSIMSALGFDEIYTYSFLGAEQLNILGMDIKKILKIQNPLSPDLEFLRPSLMPNLLEKIKQNRAKFSEMAIYEKGRVVFKETLDTGLHKQPHHLAGLIYSAEDKVLYFHCKRVVKALQQELVVPLVVESVNDLGQWKQLESIMHLGRSSQITLNDNVVGIISEIHPRIMHALDLKGRIGFFEIDLSTISENATLTKQYSASSPYQSIERDLSFFIKKDIDYAQIEKLIEELDEPVIKNLKLVDVYQAKDELNNKSITISLKLQSEDKTLTDNEINTIIEKVTNSLKDKLKVQFRENQTT